MYTLRCTARLLGRLKSDPRSAAIAGPAPTTTVLGDWYANRLNIGHQRLILCTNERSLLSVILPAKDLDCLPQRLSESVARLLMRLGLSPTAIGDETARMESVRFDRTLSRSVLASMNDFTRIAKGDIRRGKPLDTVVYDLSRCPCGPLGYACPEARVSRLLGGKSADSRKC